MSESSPDREHWSRVANAWIAWARTPNHDAFWAYRDALIEFVGPGRGEVLDVGCGEGRISRELKALGYTVTACDPVSELLDAARELASGHHYVDAPAGALPFPDASFDQVMSYNMLMDVEDVPGAVREFARVMRPDATLIVSIVHPLADHGKFEGEGEARRFVLRGSYFGRRRFEGMDERNGLTMHFAGWAQPLEAYVAALEGAGLAITSLREPQPSPASNMGEKWGSTPLFLWLKARKLQG